MAQSLSQADIEAKLAQARRHIAEKWGWFLALGIVLILVGIAAICFPLVSTIAAKTFLGWLFLIGGVFLIIHAFSAQGCFLWSLLIGVLYLIAGGYLAFFPLTGLLTLAILLAILFVAEGIMEIIMAFRVHPSDGRSGYC